jgi:hypothetical protein
MVHRRRVKDRCSYEPSLSKEMVSTADGFSSTQNALFARDRHDTVPSGDFSSSNDGKFSEALDFSSSSSEKISGALSRANQISPFIPDAFSGDLGFSSSNSAKFSGALSRANRISPLIPDAFSRTNQKLLFDHNGVERSFTDNNDDLVWTTPRAVLYGKVAQESLISAMTFFAS